MSEQNTDCITLCKKQPLTTGLKIFLLLTLVFAVFVILKVITIRLKYKPTFDWWNTFTSDTYNNGPSLVNYKKRFNLFNMLSSYENRIIYSLSSIRVPPSNKTTVQQQNYIFGDIMPYATYNDENQVQQGCLTPRALCESIKPSYNCGDSTFDQYIEARQINVSGVPLDLSNVNLGKTDPSDGDFKTNSAAQYKNIFDEYNKQISEGSYIYPSDTDTSSWARLIILWLGEGWCLQTVMDGTSSFLLPTPTPDNPGNLLQDGGWYNFKTETDADGNINTTSNPTNFLARMGIGPQSPVITYFCNGTYSINGMKVDPYAFQNLLGGHGSNPGGWVGFVKGMGDLSYDEYANYVRSRVDYQLIPPPPPPCNGGQKGLAGFFGALSAFAPLAMMVPFLIPEAGLALALTSVPAIAGGAASVAIGVYSGVKAADGCTP